MNLPLSLKKIPYFPLISRIARKNNINIWLVGGFLRDIYLKKKKDLIDFDFCVERDTTFIVKEFAGTISSKYIILDKTQESLRVIFKRKGKIYTYDFTRIRGKTFSEDLSLRDFSINALGVNLNDKKIKLIDLFNTKKDLDQKVIRVIKEEVIPQDPLRILRGFAFSANYGFHIEAKTLRYMVKYKNLIKNVSKERINEEFFKILS
ncbi:MAG: CCA tRNA nucleotidyltransferase, partial [Candidatus Omnitrophica bacterium]|nr:CCA tRNA nucleotidyltransferase [Candidatus Omnitrophota bacterium]